MLRRAAIRSWSLAALLAAGAAAPAPALQLDSWTPVPPPPPVERAFPVRAAHDFGTFGNGFGGGRGHAGHDVLARCGAPVVAAREGRVRINDVEGAAGNYLVVTTPGGAEHVYMHLLAPSRLRPGRRVEAGDVIGRVGQTGRASTCHLHFESWTAPGWFRGGTAVDPLPALKRWKRTA